MTREQESHGRNGDHNSCDYCGRAGLPVGSGDVLAYCAAMGALDPTDLLDLYWGGRTALVTRRENIGVYDRVFRRFFLGTHDPVRELLKLKQPERTRAEGVLQIPATDPGEELQEQVSLGLMASELVRLAAAGRAGIAEGRIAVLDHTPTGDTELDAALRSAKLAMIHSDGVFRKPLYWAPFQLYSGA